MAEESEQRHDDVLLQEKLTEEALEIDSPEPSDADVQPSGQGFGRRMLSIILAIAIVAVLAYLFRTFLFQPYEIPSASMETSIMTGDIVLTEKLSKNFSSPNAGEIITFDDPNLPARTLIKRVIATAGQTVDIKNDRVYIDGEAIDEPYTNGLPTRPLSSSKGIEYPLTIPEDHVWVMGDNRTNSQDSRYFGPIPVSSISGHAILKYWPISSFGTL